MAKIKKKITNSTKPAEATVNNGLTEAILGFNPISMGTQLSQTDTIFKNNRWYMISNQRQVLSQIYVEHGLVQTIVDVPVDDGMRGGIEVKTQQLSPDQVEDLHSEIERENICDEVLGRALKWNRLFGGSGIIIMTDQDPKEPFNIDAIGPDSPLEFRAVDMWELFYDKQNAEGYNPSIQEEKFEFYNYYGTVIHKSRIMKMKGLTAPSFVRPRLRGWGFSVVESLVRSINQYLKSNNLAFEVLDEFKLDIFKMKGLTQTLLAQDGTAQVQKRVALANQQKNFQNALTMDAEDDFMQKQLSFSGLSDVMREIRIQVASDMRMPLTKIFGMSATGFNSGEDDIENYNAMVESQVRAKCKYEAVRIVEIKCQKMFGFVPDDIQIDFKSLRILSSEQEENVKNAKMTRIMQALEKGLLSTKEAKDALNKGELLPIQLDTSLDTVDSLPGSESKEDEKIDG